MGETMLNVSEFKGFYELLCETINAEEGGMYKDLIKYCPSFFKLLCNILEEGEVDWHTKLIIDAALAYFVIPNDIISESEHGAIGYIDDVFICAYVLKEIKDKVSEKVLIDFWDEESDILDLVEEVYKKSKKIIRPQYTEILEFVGLKQNEKTTFSVKRGRNVNVDKLLEQALFENQELYDLLAYLSRKRNGVRTRICF